MIWNYECVSCYVSPSPVEGYEPVFRAYNGSNHLYIRSQQAHDELPENYTKEGLAFYISPGLLPGHSPLYTLYNQESDNTFCTIDETEKNLALNNGYIETPTLGFVTNVPGPGLVPLYRLYNSSIIDHYYTTNSEDLDLSAPKLNSEQLKALITEKLGAIASDCKIVFNDENYHIPTESLTQRMVNDFLAHQLQHISANPLPANDFVNLLKSHVTKETYRNGRKMLPYPLGVLWEKTTGKTSNIIAVYTGNENDPWGIRIVDPKSKEMHVPDNFNKDVDLIII
ncbi:MAG: hypothetical protein NWF04_02370 [Candidatus Bathyarchaeota archaeon]|nr:hypothetical protein [Candidatus Bathyarchaeota archaeon]